MNFNKGQLVQVDDRFGIYLEFFIEKKTNRRRPPQKYSVEYHKILVGKQIAKCTWNEEKRIFKNISKPFSSFKLPKIRKVSPSLLARDLVSVQPMSLSGKLSFLDYTYGSIATSSLSRSAGGPLLASGSTSLLNSGSLGPWMGIRLDLP